jgi:GAF domain-containing protein
MFARIAHDLAEQHGTKATTLRIIELARGAVGCDLAAIWHLSETGGATLDAATEPVQGRMLSRIISETREGPAWEALQHHTTVLVNDLRREARWPEYREAAQRARLPYRSVVAYSLDIEQRDLGALVLYAQTPEFFSDSLMGLGGVFANHAAIALDAAHSLDAVEELKVALNTNRTIGVAVGILMAEYKISEDTAFGMLRTASRHTHRPLPEMAEDVKRTGALADWTRRPA